MPASPDSPGDSPRSRRHWRRRPAAQANLRLPPESEIRAAAGFPATTRAIVAAGSARQIEFQDAAYAELYRQRLTRVLAAESASDPAGLHGHALTREAARFLALWMAYDDVIRVAYLKCRAHRFARVRREVAAESADVVRIVDYFGPGAEEIGSLLPAMLARRLEAWDRRRQARGKSPLAFSLHLRTDSDLRILRVAPACRHAGDAPPRIALP